MTRRKAFQRSVISAVLLAAAALVYFRPLSVLLVARDAYLSAIGMRGAFVRVGGHRIHYYRGGEGPPLVVVHGVASRAADAALIYRELMRTRRVYALDLLGYGESDKPADSDYSVPTQAELVRGFMDAVGVREADVMGISMGGWIALKVAADHPERVRKLVLVSSAGLSFPTTLTDRSFSPRTLDELRASFALQTDNASKIPTFVLRDFLRRKSSELVVRRSMASMLTQRDTLDTKLQRVTMPVLLVWGTQDRIVPFSLAARMQQEMPQAELVALDGCGHLAIVECRDRALPAITRFLRSAAAAPPLSNSRGASGAGAARGNGIRE
jgi:pimeloyl-ACP methyl ester carboxylesterase